LFKVRAVGAFNIFVTEADYKNNQKLENLLNCS